MTTANAAAGKTATEKVHEKLAEKRRALGRGLESLLPGPRVVTASPTLPQSAQKDGASDVASSQFSVLSSQGTSVATRDAVPETLNGLQAAGQTGDFTGYIFVVTNFTNAHGEYFISDFSGGFTNGALMLVVNQTRDPNRMEDLNN